jgi:dihydroxyacetone kinase
LLFIYLFCCIKHLATDPKVLKSAILGATQAVIEAEPSITKYDTILGDGDCGQTLKTAALGK